MWYSTFFAFYNTILLHGHLEFLTGLFQHSVVKYFRIIATHMVNTWYISLFSEEMELEVIGAILHLSLWVQYSGFTLKKKCFKWVHLLHVLNETSSFHSTITECSLHWLLWHIQVKPLFEYEGQVTGDWRGEIIVPILCQCTCHQTRYVIAKLGGVDVFH